MMDYFIAENFDYTFYKDKSVLIVGGGPTTAEVKWEHIDYDYVWTCTNFFMNERLTDQDIDLVALGNLQDYTDKRLLGYLDSNPTTKILFENNYLYHDTLSKNINFIERYKDRIFYGETEKKNTGIVGPPARMIVLAANLGFKNIYFVGIDGFDFDMKNVHAFTKEDGLREGATHNEYTKYYVDHTNFASNIHKYFGNRINFHNLGEAGKSHNTMSAVTRTLFPLNTKLYEAIR